MNNMNNMTEKENKDFDSKQNHFVEDFEKSINDCIAESECSATFIEEDLVWISYALNFYVNSLTRNQTQIMPPIPNDVLCKRIKSLQHKVNRIIED